MNRGVQPKKVAPLIRGARYSFLIAGWFYGEGKKAVFMKIEEVERGRREAAYREEMRIKLQNIKENSIEEVSQLFKEMGYVPEPGWEKLL